MGTNTCRTVESENPVKLSRRMIDLRSGPAHVGKHDDRTATQTTEDLAGALTSEGLPQRREQLREPALFLHGESVAVKNTPTTTSPTVARNGTSMEQHSILSLLQRQAGAETTGCALGLPACHRSRSTRCMHDRIGAGSNAETAPIRRRSE